VITVIRFTRGLGSVTNLSDQYPWGLWVGFDVLVGIGITAGSFVLTAVVYVFHVKKFRPIVRAVILTAFLGYLLEVLALMYDLGRPWNLWRPMIMWNPSSPLFAVAWCVIVYTAVLALEFSGAVFDKLKWSRALRLQQIISVPLVIVGTLVAVIHQSSLGALYLIVPGKLHAIWSSSMLPALFFISSVCAGIAMCIVESRLSARVFGRALEMPILKALGRVLVALLGVVAVLRISDLAIRGTLGTAFAFDYESWMFQLEFWMGVALPFALLAFPKVRDSARGLYGASLLTLLGFVVNRLNVSITGLQAAQGGAYVPAWSEIAITLMLVALGFAAFGFAVRHLNVYPPEETDQETFEKLEAASPAAPVRNRVKALAARPPG
jgi:Ni/Fe-hydrogenase subunit HybB-like protein